MKAVILAGGQGTRMGKHTKLIPKPMLKVGNKPILEHQINLLTRYGITDVTILVNYLKDSIIEYFNDGTQFGAQIDYFEEPQPLGTVGGIKEIEDQLDSDFLVLYGDVMIEMHLGRFIEFHQSKKSQCSLVLHPNDHPFDSDLVETNEEDIVTGFFSKPHPEGLFYKNLVNAGAYIFSPYILKHLKKGEKADFGKHIFPAIYNKVKMFGYNTTEYLKDMGTPSRWDEVNKAYLSGKIARSNYEHKQKAIFLDRDGVINVERSYIKTPEELELYDFTTDAIKCINKSEYISIVVTNQALIARNMCTLEELGIIHKKLETELGNKGAKIDALYFCPHHPDKGFPEERPEYKIDCECRKPKPGMLLNAARDFNIDLRKSFMIGDTERDIVAGKSAGCATIGVMTGYGMKNTKVRPDFFFNDLKEATNYLIKEPHLSLFEKISAIESKSENRLIVSIAGNARTGKSILAAYLKWKLEQSGKKVALIELDNWILSEDQREETMNVFDRFQISKIESDIKKLLRGEEIKARQYANHTERESMEIIYKLDNYDVVLVEGIVGLNIETLKETSDLTIFMSNDKKTHFERFKNYYLWRGKNEIEIKKLYNSRLKDEYQLIDQNEKKADIVLKNSEKFY